MRYPTTSCFSCTQWCLDPAIRAIKHYWNLTYASAWYSRSDGLHMSHTLRKYYSVSDGLISSVLLSRQGPPLSLHGCGGGGIYRIPYVTRTVSQLEIGGWEAKAQLVIP